MANVNFGMAADIRDSQIVPFPLEAAYHAFKAGQRPDPFHQANLKNIEIRTYTKKKYVLLEGETVAKGEKPTVDQVTPESIASVLDFNFLSPDGTYQHSQPFFELDMDNENYARDKEWADQMLAQIWGACMGFGTAGDAFTNAALKKANDGKDLKSYRDYLKAVKVIFDTGNDGKPVYVDSDGKPLVFRIKLTTYEDRIQFPRFDNFVEVYSDKVASRLTVKPDDSFVLAQKSGGRGKKGSGATTTAAASEANQSAWPSNL